MQNTRVEIFLNNDIIILYEILKIR